MDWLKFNDSLNLNDSLTLMMVYATGPRPITYHLASDRTSLLGSTLVLACKFMLIT